MTNSASTFTASGGSAAVTVTTARDCTWSAASSASWLSISGASGGQGNGSVAYAVAANLVPAARSGSISVASARVAVTQEAAPCRFSLSRTGDTIGPTGGSLSVSVSTVSGCGWGATSTQSWIGVASGQSGNGNGTVGLSIAANGGARRVGVVNVAGQTYTVTQNAAPPTPTPPPPSPTPPPAPIDVRISGVVSGLSKSCPDATFSIGSDRVVADRSTEYKGGNCGDLRNGSRVVIDGTRSSGAVRAAKIEINKDGSGGG